MFVVIIRINGAYFARWHAYIVCLRHGVDIEMLLRRKLSFEGYVLTVITSIETLPSVCC
jgi:ABC-type proline/glycine betaine transport system permease subunit